MLSEHSHVENSSEILSNNNLNGIFDLQLFNHRQTSSLFDEVTLINNIFQVFVSLILCIAGLIGTLLHIRIFLRRCSHHFFMQSFIDFCHLMNILFPHIIVIIVYIRTSTNLHTYCPLATFVFSLASFGSIGFLCLGALSRYMYLFQNKSKYRCIHHRLLAHRIILITSISWLIIHFPKVDIKESFLF